MLCALGREGCSEHREGGLPASPCQLQHQDCRSSDSLDVVRPSLNDKISLPFCKRTLPATHWELRSHPHYNTVARLRSFHERMFRFQRIIVSLEVLTSYEQDRRQIDSLSNGG